MRRGEHAESHLTGSQGVAGEEDERDEVHRDEGDA
jgi:hypothetical protein